MSEIASEAYGEAVARVLAAEFHSVNQEPARSAVAAAVAKQHANPDPGFGFIVDHPALAKWRLYQDDRRPERVQIAGLGAQGAAPEDRINEALRAI